MGLARALDSIRTFADTGQGHGSVPDAQRACRMIAATIGLVSDELTHLGSTLATAPIPEAVAVDAIRRRRSVHLMDQGGTGQPEIAETLAVRASDVARLDRERFAMVVREALRLCDRPDLLNASPLCTSPLLVGRTKERSVLAGGPALSAFLRDECRRLFTSPRDQILDRVMERTFFHPACKQEAIAADLGLTYSTYRRYLARAVARLVDALHLQIALCPAMDMR
jgi:hypothetical protein